MTPAPESPYPPDPGSGPVGLFGGTFNPIHLGHLAIARDALRLASLSSVWFLPCAVPPHKPLPHGVTDAHRLAMLRLALADTPSFRLCPVEFALPPPSYTLRTVEALQARYPATRFVFIVGADSLQQLHTWHRPLDLLARIPFLPLARPGFTLSPADIQLPAPWPDRLLAALRTASLVPAASSAIRADLAAHRTSPLVPPAVLRYILDHSLYQEHDP